MSFRLKAGEFPCPWLFQAEEDIAQPEEDIARVLCMSHGQAPSAAW